MPRQSCRRRRRGSARRGDGKKLDEKCKKDAECKSGRCESTAKDPLVYILGGFLGNKVCVRR
jgi:hypothetical protein